MVTQQWTSIDIPNGSWVQYTPGGTTVNVSSAESLTTNGYVIFYNGLILQWGLFFTDSTGDKYYVTSYDGHYSFCIPYNIELNKGLATGTANYWDSLFDHDINVISMGEKTDFIVSIAVRQYAAKWLMVGF